MLQSVLSKRIFPILFLISVFSFNGFANLADDNGDITNYKGSEWKLYKDVEGVKIFFKLEERHDIKRGMHKEYLLIQIQNNSNENLEIKWKDELWYDEKCVNCQSNSEEFNKSIIINSGLTIMGDCSDNNFPELRIHSKFLNYDLEELTKYEMSNIQVTQIK